MKKCVLIIFSIFMVANLEAADLLNTAMKDMRDGMTQVQDGFFYNNKASLLDGIEKIKKANILFQDEKSAETILPLDKKKYSKIAYVSVQNLNNYLTSMKDFVNADSLVNASDSYSGVVRSCTHCHAITRGW
jgi:hypothetical protein